MPLDLYPKPRLRPEADTGAWVPARADANHAAASYEDPAMAGWQPSSGSADAVLLDELPLIRDRNVDLERNNGYVAGANQTLKDCIVGHQLRLNPSPVAQLLGLTNDQAEDWSRITRAEFESWAHTPSEIDAARDLNLRGLTIQALGSWFLTGSALAIPIWRPRPGCRWNTRLQVIESHRLQTPEFWTGRTNIRGGKEIDRDGATTHFWIRKSHPGDERFQSGPPSFGDQFQYRRVPAFYPWGRQRVIHLYDKDRPGQSVGKPLVAAVMREFRMATHYPRVELQAVIANSLVAGVLESALDAEASAGLFKAQGGSGMTPQDLWAKSVADSRRSTTLKPGATLALPLGAKFVGFTPSRPNNAFSEFMESVLRNIAAGLNMPYELLSKDFTKTNYSSARAALLEGWRYFMSRRSWLEENWLNAIYGLWLEEAVNAGAVACPGFYDNRYAWSTVRRWTMSGRGWVDPAKEAIGAQKRMESGISNLAIECQEQGTDWMEVLDQQKIIETYAADIGVQLYTPTAAAPGGVDLGAENADTDAPEDAPSNEDKPA